MPAMAGASGFPTIAAFSVPNNEISEQGLAGWNGNLADMPDLIFII